MQNLPRISKQFQPMQRIPTKKPTVQKPCIDRANPDFSGLHNKKERQILRFDVQNLVHLQESNRGHKDFQSFALPTELEVHMVTRTGIEPMLKA